MPFELNYDQMILLDAEDLAEAGIAEAYESLLPELEKYVQQPAQVEELKDHDVGRYSVKCGSREFAIHGPELDDDSWGSATHAFFAIVNEQLANSACRFYAISGGNDLGGIFPDARASTRCAEGSPKQAGLALPANRGAALVRSVSLNRCVEGGDLASTRAWRKNQIWDSRRDIFSDVCVQGVAWNKPR